MVWWTATTTTTMTRRKCNTGRFTLSRARRNSQLHGAEDLPNDGRLTLISKPLRHLDEEVVGGMMTGRGTTREVTEHTKMADTLGSFVRPRDNFNFKPPQPSPRRHCFSSAPHAHKHHHGGVQLTSPAATSTRILLLATTTNS